MSLGLGAALVAAWLVGLVGVVRLHLPPVLAKADVGVAALAWAAHVLYVILHNRALDQGRTVRAHRRGGGHLPAGARGGRRLSGGSSPPPRE